jgi:hypothetical protein
MAAIADPPLDTLVSQPRREIAFAARRADLRLTKVPRYPVLGQGGQKVDETRGVVVKFQDGQLSVPTEGKLRTEQGHEVDAAEILEWLQRHPLLGNHDEGFFEVPQAAPPVSEEETERIGEFSLLHDTDSLRAMLESEQRGWNRQGLVGPVTKAIARIEQIRADFEAQQEAEASQPAPKKAPKA